MEDRDNFYEKLKVQLDDTTTFPSDYLYKFIVAVAGDKLLKYKKYSMIKELLLLSKNLRLENITVFL